MYDLAYHAFTTPRGNVAPMAYRKDTNDWNTLTACMTEDEYGLADLPYLTGAALDVGGYLGGVAIGLVLDNPDLRVLVVEPVPSNINLILTNIAVNQLGDRVTLVDGAAGTEGTTVIRYGFTADEADLREKAEHHAFVGNASFLDRGRSVPHAEREVVCYRVGELARRAGVGVFSLIKIDCEGCEWSFLDDPDIGDQPYIVGEWHNNDGHTRQSLLDLLDYRFSVTFSGPEEGPGGFVAVGK